MSELPPRLDSPLVRVLRLSLFNGVSVTVIAGLGTAFSLLAGDFLGVGIGMLAMAAGLMELHGRGQVMQEDVRGFAWLAGSQLWLMAVITGYAIARYTTFDPETALNLIEKALRRMSPEDREAFKELGIGRRDLVSQANSITWIVVVVATFFYQGSMWRFYRRAAKALGCGERGRGQD